MSSSSFGFSGTIKREGIPIEGARVYLLDGDTHEVVMTTLTNIEGIYKFNGLSKNKEYHRVAFYKDQENNIYKSLTKPFDRPNQQIGSAAASNIQAVSEN